LRVEHKGLADLAASIADGVPVDWSEADERVSPADRRLASHLRLVESIASLHRSIPSGEQEADPGLTQPWKEDDVAVRSRPSPPAASTAPHWGRLTLLERIGEGTSGAVYRAWDNALHRDVALKLMRDEGSPREARARILDEARRLARVRHAHVVHVYGAEQHDDHVGLWMELVRGESLEQIVAMRGPFGAREAALIGLDLCAALAAVHAANLLHRDVKAQNVMREDGGRIVLMDFGTGEELSGTNRLVGTPLYLAPEIFRGQKASIQSDLYSLAVLLFYLVTGKFPVMAGSMEQLAKAHASRVRHSLRDLRPDVPEAFVRTVERALDSDPARRYQSAGEMEAALRESLGPAQPAVADTVAPVPAPRRLFGFSYLLAAGVLVAAIVSLIIWTRRTELDRAPLASAVRTIAVLPMTDVSGSGLPEYFARGLTDELIATLGQIHLLNVRSGLSVKAVKDLPAKEIAERLAVDALLETTLSVATDGGGKDNVRVRANLISAGTQTVLWSQAFDRPRGELLTLQSDIARAIARALKATLSPTEAGRLGSPRQTNPAAEEAYLLGRMHLDRYGAGSAALALKAFDRALKLDPANAPAHVGAAWAHISLGQNGLVGNAQARAQAMAAVRRALELDEGFSEAHAILGHAYFVYEWDWAAADRAFQRSIDLNPSSAVSRTYYADYLEAMGRFDDAIVQAEMAKRLEPESSAAARRYALALYYKRDFIGAERALREAQILDPTAAGADILEGRIAEAVGRIDAALESTRRAVESSGGGGVPLRVQVIRLEALSGQRSQATAAVRKLQEEAQSRAIRLTARDLAYLQLALNESDAALASFERAIEDRDPSLVWLAVDPRLDSLQHDDRFLGLLSRIGLPHRP
jgi:eukaryotic-like serine/threonine-protein kinase